MSGEILHAIIGTAGHIDHGKTALVGALTGCDTDRLREEKERGISIDLGFAALVLGDQRVGIVDVPGHERFIRNMLAGAHGVDLVLLTVAADDGVMPQTEEHLDIVHLLGIGRGVVAITKTDLVPPARVDAVREDVEILLAGTRLEGAPMIPVSVVSGEGVAAIRAELGRQLAAAERPRPPGRFRLPVDRAFVQKGHGVVVTGTAIAGSVSPGDEVRILPGGEPARVRSVEVHGAPVEAAGWGQRVALNLAGVERTEIVRGHVVADPALTVGTARFDAWLEVRPGARRGLRHHARVRLHAGTAEVLGKVVMLDEAAVLPAKAAGWVQLVLEEPVTVLRGDRFIVRAENASATLGGGEVVLPVAERHRRRDPEVAARLEALRSGTPLEAATAVLALAPEFVLGEPELAERLNLEPGVLRSALAAADAIIALPDPAAPECFTTDRKWRQVCEAVTAAVARFHTASPLEPGPEMEAVRSQTAAAVPPRLFRVVVDRLAAEGLVVRRDGILAAPGHRVALARGQEALAGTVERVLAAAGVTPPDLRVLAESVGAPRRDVADVLSVLEKRGAVVRVVPDLYFAAAAVADARARLEAHLAAHREITAAAFRDLLDVSRKFSIALLDYFDRTGVTLRVGDVRKLRRGG